MREILTRINELSRGLIEVKIFGDKVILDEGAYSTTLCARRRPYMNRRAELAS